MLERDISKITVVVFVFFWSVFLHSQTEYSAEEALKVIRLIEKIQSEQIEKREGDLRNVVVSESEFNSYIAYLIEVEQEEIMKELKLKFFENNIIEGKLVIDLQSQGLPKFLPPRMVFFLRGKLEVDGALVRLDLKELFLGTQRIQPEILDLVIFIGSIVQNTEPFSIEDWVDLPYGIKNIQTGENKAIFYY